MNISIIALLVIGITPALVQSMDPQRLMLASMNGKTREEWCKEKTDKRQEKMQKDEANRQKRAAYQQKRAAYADTQKNGSSMLPVNQTSKDDQHG